VTVLEELQVLTDDERVEETFVNQVESTDRPILPGIMDGELQHRGPSWFGRWRNGRHINVELHRFRNAGNQRHPAPTTDSSTIRPDLGIHRTAVHHVLREGDGRTGLEEVLRNDGALDHALVGGRCCAIEKNRREGHRAAAHAPL
jgi:hypothetical protein